VTSPFPLPSGRFGGLLRVPGSKSVTNRALLAAACADGESTIMNPLDSSDTRALASALRHLGAEILFEGASWRVRGPLRPRGDAREVLTIDVEDAGTPARFLAALLAAIPGKYILDGSGRMRDRPMAPLFGAIRDLSGEVRCLAEEGFLPAAIRGGTLRGGRVRIRGDVSSQFLSALMLASPLVPRGIELEVEGPVSSAPYLALTRRVLESFGGRPGTGYRPAQFTVPGDDSAACFPIAGALVSAGTVTLLGLSRVPEQPDAVFRSWAEEAGGRLSWSGKGDDAALSVDGRHLSGARALRPLTVNVDSAPDAALPLVSLLAFAEGTSVLSGARRLRDKESDRLSAALDLLERAGSAAREDASDAGPRLVIDGATGAPRRADFAAHGDHRVAMAAAVLALGLPRGSTLDEPGVVRKSFPGFFAEWARLAGEAVPASGGPG
jgi:3-phosphoshikimate 1-carboxyvinyltransferase